MASTLETRFSGQSTVSVPPGHAIAQIGSEWYGAVPDQTGGWTVTDGLSVGDPWGAGVTVLLPNEETRSYDQYIPDPVVNGRRTYWISRTSVSTLPDTTLSVSENRIEIDFLPGVLTNPCTFLGPEPHNLVGYRRWDKHRRFQ
jgi:hypothetical protein